MPRASSCAHLAPVPCTGLAAPLISHQLQLHGAHAAMPSLRHGKKTYFIVFFPSNTDGFGVCWLTLGLMVSLQGGHGST